MSNMLYSEYTLQIATKSEKSYSKKKLIHEIWLEKYTSQ